MARACEFCGKGSQFGRNIRHRHSGQWKFRAPRTKRQWVPNLQSVRALTEGKAVRRVRACTRCIKAGKVVRAI